MKKELSLKEKLIERQNEKVVEIKKKMLCPRWGYCKAKKKCPLPIELFEKYTIYVRGECINKNVQIFKSHLRKEIEED